MRESKFQHGLIEKLKVMFPGCIVLKNDPNYIQGIPDILILYRQKWAAIECKRSSGASHRPNQDYYISMMNDMGYAAFVYPENEAEVLDELSKFLVS